MRSSTLFSFHTTNRSEYHFERMLTDIKPRKPRNFVLLILPMTVLTTGTQVREVKVLQVIPWGVR